MALLTFPLNTLSTTAFPIKQSPMLNTLIQTPASGRGELRIPLYEFPRWKFAYDFTYIPGDASGTNTIWQQLTNFYMAVQGAASDWLFQLPYDYSIGIYNITAGTGVVSGAFVKFETVIQASTGTTAQILFAVTGTSTMMIGGFDNQTNPPDNTHNWVGQSSGAVYNPNAVPVLVNSQAIATGDGVTTAFTMYRTMISGGAQDIIQNFVFAPNIYVAGSLISPSSYSINQYGTLTFTSAPASGATISWTGQFFYRCRFEEDTWDSFQEDYHQLWSAEGIKWISVIL